MIELEKKWLVDKEKCPIPSDAVKWDVVQGYLNTMSDEWIIRCRYVGHDDGLSSYFLELKSRGLLAREELRYIIDKEEFDETLKKCGGVVKKTRYLWKADNVQYEVDFYKDHKFVTCEVEFDNMKQCNAFKPPEWCIEDVTFNPKYKNVNLGK